MKKELFKAEMLNHKLNAIEQQLGELQAKADDMRSLQDALEEWKLVGDGEELLIPIARGIFAQARSVGDPMLKVNVGQGLVVDKSVDEVKAMLEEQLTELHEAAEGLQQEFEEGLAELQRMDKETE